jgi:hypothetical protein
MAQQEPVPPRRATGRFGTIFTALLAGFAGGLLSPLVLPRLERNLRPATKRMFKTGIALYERGRERAAELGEMASDMMAEARAEYEAEQAMAGGPLAGGPLASESANEVVRLRNGHGKEASSPNA